MELKSGDTWLLEDSLFIPVSLDDESELVSSSVEELCVADDSSVLDRMPVVDSDSEEDSLKLDELDELDELYELLLVSLSISDVDESEE